MQKNHVTAKLIKMVQYPPYYSIKCIHFENNAKDGGGDVEVCILGAKNVENIRIVSSIQSPSHP